MQINPYITFNGQCRAAFKFYEEILGGKIMFQMTWGEMPGADQFPKEMHQLIMHTSLTVGDQTLMGADAEFDITPSFKVLRQNFSKSAEG